MAGQITVSLAVDALKEACHEYEKFEQQKAAALKRRDTAIRDAAQYLPITTLQALTGLSREQVYRIRTAGTGPSKA